MAEHLQIDDAHLVPGITRRGGDALDAKRLKTQKDLRVEQAAGVYEQQFHRGPLSTPSRFPRHQQVCLEAHGTCVTSSGKCS